LGIGLLDHDNAGALDNLGFDLLLFGGFEVAFVLSFLAHALNRVHDILLLREEGIAQVRRPLDVISKALHDIGKCGHGLDTGIPRLLGDSIGECFIFEAGVFGQPLLQLNQLERIG